MEDETAETKTIKERVVAMTEIPDRKTLKDRILGPPDKYNYQ